MRGQRLSFVACALVAIHAALACSSNQKHEPFAAATCAKPPCSANSAINGGQNSGSGSGGADAGVRADAAATDCFVETTSGITLCKSTPLCMKYVLDRGLWPDCGFDPSASGIDLECVCLGQNAICPVSVMSDCGPMEAQVANDVSEDTLCGNLSASSTATCRDLNSVSPIGKSGAGGASSCDPVCANNCNGSPTCVAGCGCSNNP
ncbi:MAG TPA: hypothetical protein VHU80_04000 [Polyangiaceae bacterium]|jgi:hypothetical protein|nr:hypothetical protein [Polyangiaceae bacterium]